MCNLGSKHIQEEEIGNIQNMLLPKNSQYFVDYRLKNEQVMKKTAMESFKKERSNIIGQILGHDNLLKVMIIER